MVISGLQTCIMDQNLLGGSPGPETSGGGGSIQGGKTTPPDTAQMWAEIIFAKNRLDKQENLMQAVVIIGLIMVATMLLSLLIFFIQTVREDSHNQQLYECQTQ